MTIRMMMTMKMMMAKENDQPTKDPLDAPQTRPCIQQQGARWLIALTDWRDGRQHLCLRRVFVRRPCVSIVSLNMSAGRPAATAAPEQTSVLRLLSCFFGPFLLRDWGFFGPSLLQRVRFCSPFVHKLRLFLHSAIKHQIGDYLLKRFLLLMSHHTSADISLSMKKMFFL